MSSILLRTPSGKNAELLERQIDSLNYEFALEIPNPKWQSPSSRPVAERTKEEQCHAWMKELFWRDDKAFERACNDFREQVRSEIREHKQWVHKPNQEYGTVPSKEDNIRRNSEYGKQVSDEERQRRVAALREFIYSELWITRGGENPLEGSQSSPRPRNLANGPHRGIPNGNHQGRPVGITPQAKRKASNNQEVFYTAPSSPVLPPEEQYPSLGNPDEYDDPMRSELNLNKDALDGADKLKTEAQRSRSSKKRQSKITDHMFITKSSQQFRPPARKPPPSFLHNNSSSSGLAESSTSPEISFATTAEDSVFDRSEAPRFLGTSFETTVTEPCDETATQPDSVDRLMMSEEFSMVLKSVEESASTYFEFERGAHAVEQEIVGELTRNGPFSKDKECFSEKVPLRARYELERVKQTWNVSPKQILVGDKPYEKHSDFWQWLGDVSRRMDKTLPEKPSLKAWNAAIGCFEGDRHSEAVILSGTLDWCEKNEPGIFKLRLNPLKIERTCRFYRRFGSDRFLSITMPSPSQPPKHLRLKDPTSLREILTNWLVNNDHHLLKRTWKAFYVDDVKTKSKSKSGKPRVRVDFFAVDGSDFTTRLSPPTISPSTETSASHTRMTIDQLLQWHIPLDDNRNQTDCKLFSRIGLALSKTWATVVIEPRQFLKLPDPPGRPVMNDGCALMSRPLARKICEELGIDGNIPSAFQGRIAGAKGLWMVDKDRGDDERIWIEVSDSQLKIKPHPSNFFGSVDKEKITFEVASWSKPLRPSELNTQLLEVLNNRGQIRARVANIAREAINDVYKEFEAVMESNSIPLARALIQKIRPTTTDDGRTNIRRIDQWLSQNIESVIRFLEAGFSPRDFTPLRERMRRCLVDTLNRYVNELHIPVPLSTYAYCIADPYGVLEEDEVHFAFSGQWRDCSYFDDAIVDGMDVLVGRTPAHCPWDIQRRKAVWKSELRHFKDVIVFPTKGTTPLASLLSGGDYDGDRPWVCWDQGIVKTFTNTIPPLVEPGPDHFGLVKHARPMSEVGSVVGLLQNAFKFNLAMSHLGRCTVEHEKLAYEEKEGISSPLSLELATLLSHLVDSKKSGLELTEEQWSKYRKTISPRERRVPAYKDLGAKKGKRHNINDYLRFEVAFQEREKALRKFNQQFGGIEDKRDESLLRPWKSAVARAEREKQEASGGAHSNAALSQAPILYETLKTIEARIDEAYHKWTDSCHPNETSEISIGFKIQLAAELLNRIQPPDVCHALIQTWQNSEYEWRLLLASGAYYLRWWSAFPIYAAGETLCWIKIGQDPARLIRDQIYFTMKVSTSAARRLAGAEAEELAMHELERNVDSDEDDSEEYDRDSVVDALNEIDRAYQSLH